MTSSAAGPAGELLAWRWAQPWLRPDDGDFEADIWLTVEMRLTVEMISRVAYFIALVHHLLARSAATMNRDTLTTFTKIISLWRDEAAHGRATPFSTANADEALRQLLHMSQWVNREWDNLT
jgi:hypothetical protein